MQVEIHTTSAFSFLRGASLPQDLAHRAAELGYRSVGLLDHDGLYGAPQFYRAARAAGLRAMVGAMVHVSASGVRSPVGLCVRSREGYRNLCRLLSRAHARIPKDVVRTEGLTVDLDALGEHHAGLAALLPAGEGVLANLVPGSSPSVAWARAVTAVFGTGATAVEHIRHATREGVRNEIRLGHLAEALKLPRVASTDVRYTTPARAPVYDVLTCARLYETLESAGTRLAPNRERGFATPDELAARFRDARASLRNAEAWADACDFTLEKLGYRFPDYPLPPGETAFSYLEHLVHLGARDRFRPLDPRSHAQLARELALIAKLDLAGYFLIVWDIVRYCRERGILVQGRGSAANSAVCYALGITAVDPVRMGLLFERFLSEERGEWPDIDLDLPAGERREEVIQYVYARYGPHGAAMTANVITYRARSAVRESGKALGFPVDVLDRLSRHLNVWGGLSREEYAARFAQGGLSPSDPRVSLLIDTAMQLERLPRHLGQHPGGMVVAHGRLDEVVPLEPATMPGRVVIQWDKDDCADLGILKVDLLGLGMMAVLEEVVPTIATHDGVTLDLAHLPHDDPATYAMLCRADTVGVFQVESRAQMATLPRMRPERFYDLVVEVAIIRPGPIVGKMVNPYLERRAGREAVTYAHPDLEPILARTLGVPLFQEQLMRVAMTAAGFTGGEAEELRRAMGSKRSVERMAALEAKLRAGMTARGYAPQAQEDVVRGISSFALYGFPESHAASFALLAYASAYIKCHFPASFTCALLNHWPMGFYHPSTVVKDAQRHGVRVLPVDVTRSAWDCTRENGSSEATPTARGGVRLGLRYVDGLRRSTGQALVDARAALPFRSIADLARRSGANERELTTLAELGALAHVPRGRREVEAADASGTWTRRSALWQAQAIAARPRGGLFERVDGPEEASPLPEMSLEERMAADFRASGLSVGRHPLALRRDLLRARGVLSAREFLRSPHGSAVAVAGAVITRQRPGTAKGFVFLTIEDETGLVNAIVTPALYQAERRTIVGAPVLVLHGTTQQSDGVTSLKVVHAEPFELVADVQGTPSIDVPDARNFH